VLSPGQPAPDVKLTTHEGKEVSLKDFRGKKVLLCVRRLRRSQGRLRQADLVPDRRAGQDPQGVPEGPARRSPGRSVARRGLSRARSGRGTSSQSRGVGNGVGPSAVSWNRKG
jgi:hypothetical protein